MANISHKSKLMPASAIRKLVPYADTAVSQGVKVYHLNIGAPDIKSPESAMEAVRNYHSEHISYSHSAGLMELRKSLVEKYYKSCGIELEPSELIVTDGGSEAIDIALQICCDEGDEIIVIEPYYTNYATFCYQNDISVKAVSSDIRKGFKVPDAEEFEKLITPKTKAIMISNPGNPTGTLYPEETMLELGKIIVKHDIFLISDEVYREFCYTDEPYFSAMNIPGAEKHVILVDSVSKRYNLCGCRIGCIVSHNDEVMTAAMKYAQARLCSPVLGQVATMGALDAPKSYFEDVKKEYIRRRDFAVAALNKMEGVYTPLPEGAFYTVVEIPVDDAENFAKWMLSEFRYEGQTTMVTPAASFYLDHSKGKHHIRVAYVLEVPELKKALKVLEEGLKAYPGRTI